MNFDRVAHIYDATRSIPQDVVKLVMRQVVSATHAGVDTRFLELGIGTGRIALPFVEAGFHYTGVDISDEMMAQLRSKQPGGRENLTLIQSTIADLPVPDESVDVVLTVHVLHLVPEWTRALDEARRVLRPDGFFVMGRNWPLPGDPIEEIRGRWRTFVAEHGVATRANNGTWDEVDAELTRRGGRTALFRVAEWSREIRPADLLDEHRKRSFSLTWDVADDVIEAVHHQMVEWVTERFGSVDVSMTSREEFLLSVTRFSE